MFYWKISLKLFGFLCSGPYICIDIAIAAIFCQIFGESRIKIDGNMSLSGHKGRVQSLVRSARFNVKAYKIQHIKQYKAFLFYGSPKRP